ncbi:MAG: TIGR01777 family protein [Caldilineae bacterium]|nr:MAG: TIGR01777 family protein [Caldilineae bacterium]
MHVIITGGTGLIGRALTQSLLADGHRVTVLSRSPGAVRGLPSGAEVVGWDARTAQGWGHLAAEADAIVNLAGAGIAEGRWTAARKKLILESRVNAGKAVVEAIEGATPRPKVLIQASAVGYYGPHGDEILTEDAAPGSDFLAQVCVAWEASTQAVEALGVRRAVIRTGVVLSMQGGAFPRLVLPFRFFAGGPLGSGRQRFPWIHIDDQVAAIRFLIEHEEASGPFNLAAPNPPTNREFVQQLGKAMGRPALLPVPALALRLLFGEMATVLLDGQRAVPAALERAGFRFTYPEALPALRDILQNGK